jgi:serine/threonine protein kinase
MVRGNSADQQSRERLWREARAAASVSHPNVCQLYEIGEADGELFIAMELLEGESLAARLARGPLPVNESREITLTMLSALDAIHARGMIHRDLKPSNIFLTPHGAKLLDFGLASVVQTAGDGTRINLTMPGTVMGTPHYMSPEQLTGEALDVRSDLFAVGAILFELVAGTTAFPGKTTAQVFHGVMYERLPSVTGSAALAALDRIIQRATHKKPADRYPDAATMAQDLRGTVSVPDSGGAAAIRKTMRLIVLPFRLLRPDPEIDFLSFSLADAVTDSLSNLQSLIVRSSLAAAKFKDGMPDPAVLASAVDVDAAVAGTLIRAGHEVRVATQLVEAPSGRLLWSQTTQVTLNDIFQLQDELTRRIVESLSLPLSAREEQELGRDAPATAGAYQDFLRANDLASDPKSWAPARDLYQRVVADDPRFAPAWAALGRVQRLIGKLGGGGADEVAAARVAVERALDLNPDLPLANSMAAQLDIDQGRARDAMVRLLLQASRRPTDPELFTALVYACRYCGLLGPSRRAHERARRLDPAVKTSVIHTFFALREYEAVLAESAGGPLAAGFALVALGREREAVTFLAEKEKTVASRLGQIAGSLRRLLVGETAEALAGLRTLIASGFGDPEGLYYFARLLARAGASDEATALLERAAAAGFCCYPSFAADEWLDPLRGSGAFAAVLERVKHEHDLAVSAYAAANGPKVLGRGA